MAKERVMTEAEARTLAEVKFENEHTVMAALWLYRLGLWKPKVDRSASLETRFIPTQRGTVKAVTYDAANGSHTSSEH